jgi:hypothetical protein
MMAQGSGAAIINAFIKKAGGVVDPAGAGSSYQV